jgi:Domain of unknown function (DUF222)
MRENPTDAELRALGEQIAEQAVHLDAAMHRLLTDLRRFDEAKGWHAQGFPSCAHWLSYRVGWDLGTARERVRVAKALVDLPRVDAALAEGKLSYSKARAITRVATPVIEPKLLQYAEVCTASQLESICRKFHAAERTLVDPNAPLPRDDERYVSISSTSSGMVCVKAFLRADEAALLQQVIVEAARHCTREERSENSPAPVAESPDVSAEDREAAANSIPATASRRLNRADGLMAVVQSYARGGSPQRSPVEMIITTPIEALRGQRASGDPAGSGSGSGSASDSASASASDRGATIPVAIVAETGTCLSPDTVRRLACDCGVVEATVDSHGAPLSVGRKTRTIPAAIKRALLLRDRTCRFPGCDHRLFLDGHHLRHWADGGETSLANTTLLCSAHHSYVHERGYRIIQHETGTLTFLDPRGKPVVAVPPRPSPPDLGWPTIRAANATSPLSAETSHAPPRRGRLDRTEAVNRLFQTMQRADGGNSSGEVGGGKPAAPPAELEDEPRRRDEDTADPDYDFAAAGHRVDDLLAWSMAELLATGVDPMAQVPAPMWPPPSWRRP